MNYLRLQNQYLSGAVNIYRQ
ncbi:hypothetical protein MTBSS4_280005 [Magnetospirillum sp. SS-4]|nr:hypothetical protein MTBSS4_280005 [Magnetospirillum sp. SS-4]